MNGYPLHPSEQDMISADGIMDQALTRIVWMGLIELTLLRLSRTAFFKRPCAVPQGLELLVALHPRVGGSRRAERIKLGGRVQRRQITPNLEIRALAGSPLKAEDAEKAGLGIKHPIFHVAVYDGVESVNKLSN